MTLLADVEDALIVIDFNVILFCFSAQVAQQVARVASCVCNFSLTAFAAERAPLCSCGIGLFEKFVSLKK